MLPFVFERFAVEPVAIKNNLNEYLFLYLNIVSKGKGGNKLFQNRSLFKIFCPRL